MKPQLPPISEKTFAAQVVALAKLLGWRLYRTFCSIHSLSGFPDLCLTRHGRLLFAELKSDRGELTPPQMSWIHALEQCPGVEVYVFRPADWPQIEQVLKGAQAPSGLK